MLPVSGDKRTGILLHCICCTFFLLSIACCSQSSSMVRVFLWRHSASVVRGTSWTEQNCLQPERLTSQNKNIAVFVQQEIWVKTLVLKVLDYINTKQWVEAEILLKKYWKVTAIFVRPCCRGNTNDTNTLNPQNNVQLFGQSENLPSVFLNVISRCRRQCCLMCNPNLCQLNQNSCQAPNCSMLRWHLQCFLASLRPPWVPGCSLDLHH